MLVENRGINGMIGFHGWKISVVCVVSIWYHVSWLFARAKNGRSRCNYSGWCTNTTAAHIYNLKYCIMTYHIMVSVMVESNHKYS